MIRYCSNLFEVLYKLGANGLRSLTVMLRDRAGNSAVELALATPMLMAAISPLLDLGSAFSLQLQVQQAAQAGAQYALRHGWNSSAISSAVTSATTAAVSANPSPSQSCGCPNGTGITSASCSTTCSNGQTAGTYVTVAAQSSYTPIVPYSLFGSGLTLTAQATVRIQ